MATLQSTSAPAIRKPYPLTKPPCRSHRRCNCGERLYIHHRLLFCPACTGYSPNRTRPDITANIAFEAADELLQRLAAAGWAIAVVGDTARLWHRDAETDDGARRTLRAGGFAVESFQVQA